jgi:hypothetical protein
MERVDMKYHGNEKTDADMEEHQNGLAVTPDAVGDSWRKNIGRNFSSLILGIDGSQSQNSFRSPTKGALIHLFTQFLSSLAQHYRVGGVHQFGL